MAIVSGDLSHDESEVEVNIFFGIQEQVLFVHVRQFYILFREVNLVFEWHFATNGFQGYFVVTSRNIFFGSGVQIVFEDINTESF